MYVENSEHPCRSVFLLYQCLLHGFKKHVRGTGQVAGQGRVSIVYHVVTSNAQVYLCDQITRRCVCEIKARHSLYYDPCSRPCPMFSSYTFPSHDDDARAHVCVRHCISLGDVTHHATVLVAHFDLTRVRFSREDVLVFAGDHVSAV